jgi:hypothetical protein
MYVEKWPRFKPGVTHEPNPPPPPKVSLLWRRGGLMWSNDPESYVGGSIANVRVSHVEDVKGNDSDKKGISRSSRWWGWTSD